MASFPTDPFHRRFTVRAELDDLGKNPELMWAAQRPQLVYRKVIVWLWVVGVCPLNGGAKHTISRSAGANRTQRMSCFIYKKSQNSTLNLNWNTRAKLVCAAALPKLALVMFVLMLPRRTLLKRLNESAPNTNRKFSRI
jgi:hypothetical protein